LIIDVLIAQRRFHQPKSTAKAVRQANRLTSRTISTLSVISKGSTEPEETPVRDALMKRLANLVDPEQNKTTGVDRQVRHIGQYAAHGTSVRDMQKATLQNVAATVNIRVLVYSEVSS